MNIRIISYRRFLFLPAAREYTRYFIKAFTTMISRPEVLTIR